ncbi:hypothetical protein DL767_003938 [Monosporascus sp. MG133]|nr:hypothetical protein DL767_003938 [Monosporascus sp. MG133]
MFFQGSLQEGINTALQEAKLVVCFVTDEESESQLWENEFLTDELLKSSLESQAVALRLRAGSQEAGFLEALFPVPRKPTLVMIQNGQLKEYIAAGTSKEDFLRRAHAALGTSSGQSRQQPAATATPAARTLEQSQAAAPATPAAEENGAPPPASSSGGATQDARVRAALAERAKRLEADKKAKEAAAKAEAEARAKARREVDTGAESSAADNVKGAERKYADELRQRKQQAAEERRRILRRIEDDRRERKEREAQERQARLLAQATNPEAPSGGSGGNNYEADGSSSPIPSAGAAATTSSTRTGARGAGSRSEHCNLQVRLLDGSTMRAGFPASGTLAGDVRPWIDSNRTDGSDAPYTFRVVLMPLPNRAVDVGEETGSTLAELGLTPSATLVLVPVPRFAEAYYGHGSSSSSSDSGSLLWRALAFLWGIPAGILGMLAGFLFGWGRGGRRQQQQQRRRRDEGGRGGGSGGDEVELDDMPARGTTTSARIRGFENAEDRRRDAQFYNGNSLNFEPRRDDDEGGGAR